MCNMKGLYGGATVNPKANIQIRYVICHLVCGISVASPIRFTSLHNVNTDDSWYGNKRWLLNSPVGSINMWFAVTANYLLNAK